MISYPRRRPSSSSDRSFRQPKESTRNRIPTYMPKPARSLLSLFLLLSFVIWLTAQKVSNSTMAISSTTLSSSSSRLLIASLWHNDVRNLRMGSRPLQRACLVKQYPRWTPSRKHILSTCPVSPRILKVQELKPTAATAEGEGGASSGSGQAPSAAPERPPGGEDVRARAERLQHDGARRTSRRRAERWAPPAPSAGCGGSGGGASCTLTASPSPEVGQAALASPLSYASPVLHGRLCAKGGVESPPPPGSSSFPNIFYPSPKKKPEPE